MTTPSEIVFIDVETGGFDPLKNPLLSFAAIKGSVVDGKVVGYRTMLDIKIEPDPTKTITDEAKRVNGYDPGVWRANAYSAIDAAKLIGETIGGVTLCGHNLKFDLEFIFNFLKEYRVVYKTPNYVTIDTMHLSHPLKVHGFIPNCKLETVGKFFGFTEKQKHEAVSDAVLCMQVYHALMKTYTLTGMMRLHIARLLEKLSGKINATCKIVLSGRP